MILGKQIKAGRILLEITQEELSKKVSVPIATLRRIENSNNISSSAITLGKIISFLEDKGVRFENSEKEIIVKIIN
jgi:transcriptional regulator with XRE-family HTH domain